MVRPEKASPTLLGGDGEDIIVILGPADLACERRQTIDRLCRGNSNREFDPSSGTRGDLWCPLRCPLHLLARPGVRRRAGEGEGGGDMRHRSSVAAVESDRGELHLVLSPARSVDTHVIRCVAIARHAPNPENSRAFI